MQDRIVYITPDFAVTGALVAADFPAIAEAGFRSVISNRPDGEGGAPMTARQESVAAWRAGLQFRHVPATKHDLLTDLVVEGMADAVRRLEGPILAHCLSGQRSAIVWAAASAREGNIDCVLAALGQAGFDLAFLRDDLEAQAHRKRWLGTEKALDCSEAAVLTGAWAAA
ncbi:MAG: TIGR01244 family sulfur transferase [Hyphomicrobiaceae bacterium]